MTEEGRGYTTAQVARRLHVSTGHIRNQIGSGRLVAHRDRGGKLHRMYRADIYRWLIAIDWPADQIRKAFPLPGPLAVVSLRKDHLRPAVAHEGPLWFDGMFDLAVALGEVRPWGAVADLASIGTGETISQVRRFSRVGDRPILIGITGDDGAEEGVFDILIPGGLSLGKIAQRIRAVRPWGK